MRPVAQIPKPGESLDGQYVLNRELGRGAAGVVFEARQLGLERKVAIKMLLPRSMGVEGVVERFQREARLASKLRHRHSVTIYSFGVYGETERVAGLPYMVMEYLEGESLHKYLTRTGQQSEEDTVEILEQALGSLEEAHDLGVIHRDLKPENLFLTQTPDGRVVKVLDFGIAKAIRGTWGSLARRLTSTGMMFGTPEYMAPEQATGQAIVTPALDVYAMGCIAFHMLVGRPPFSGTSPLAIALKHLSEPVPAIPQDVASKPLRDLIARTMAKDPEERPANAGELKRELAQITLHVENELEGLDTIATSPIKTADFPALAEPDPSRRTLEWQGQMIADLTERLESGEDTPQAIPEVRQRLAGEFAWGERTVPLPKLEEGDGEGDELRETYVDQPPPAVIVHDLPIITTAKTAEHDIPDTHPEGLPQPGLTPAIPPLDQVDTFPEPIPSPNITAAVAAPRHDATPASPTGGISKGVVILAAVVVALIGLLSAGIIGIVYLVTT